MVRLALGSIVGIPLQLRVVPQEVSPEGRKQTVYVLKLEWEQTFNDALESRTALKSPPLHALPMPDESPDEMLYPVQGFGPDPVALPEPAKDDYLADYEAITPCLLYTSPSPRD